MPDTNIDALLLSPDYIERPYATYDLLRSRHPACWSETWSAGLVTRDHDVNTVLRPPVNEGKP